MVNYQEIIKTYKLLIVRNNISYKELKSNNISPRCVKHMLSLQMIEKKPKTSLINPIYQIKDLTKLYEITYKCDFKDKEIFLRYLYDLNYYTYDLYIELLKIAFKKKDYDLLFDIIDKIILNYNNNNSIQNGITSILYTLSFITKIPPKYNNRIKKNINEDNIDDNLASFKITLLESQKALIHKRNNTIKRLISNNEFQNLSSFLEIESEKVTSLGTIYELIKYINETILRLFKGEKIWIKNTTELNISTLIYSNNFNIALKLYIIIQNKLNLNDDNLKVILEKIVLISKMMSNITDDDLKQIADLISDEFTVDKVANLFKLSLEDKTIVTLYVIRKALINDNTKLAQSLLNKPYITSCDSSNLTIKGLLREIYKLKEELGPKKLIIENNK